MAGTHTKKIIRFKEAMEEEEEDRISSLPDCLLVETLSRLPTTKEAIKTSTLSKRWQYLWRLVSNLLFSSTTLEMNDQLIYNFFLSVENTLTQYSGHFNLNKFHLNTRYDIFFGSIVNDWIHYAVKCNVQDLYISLLNDWIHYSIWEPRVGNFELAILLWFWRIGITSKSVKNLVFCGYSDPEDEWDLADIIEINAPQILSLIIIEDLLLWKLALLNVSSLVEAKLDFEKLGHYETTGKEANKEILKGLILNLRHVKELEVGYCCQKQIYSILIGLILI